MESIRKRHDSYLSLRVDNEDPDINISNLSNNQLIELKQSMKATESNWEKIKADLQVQAESDKNHLYYTADKGRDLHWHHGKRDGMYIFESVEDAIQEVIQFRIKSEPLFADALKKAIYE